MVAARRYCAFGTRAPRKPLKSVEPFSRRAGRVDEIFRQSRDEEFDAACHPDEPEALQLDEPI